MSAKLFREHLGEGHIGYDVLALQFYLLGAGYGLRELIPDGVFGNQTCLQLQALQTRLGVPTTGVLDADIKRALKTRRGLDIDSISVVKAK